MLDKTCVKCGGTGPRRAGKNICRECCNSDKRARRARERDIELTADCTDELAAFGTALQRACVESVLRDGSVVAAAKSLQLEPSELRAHLSELKRRAATRGWSPGNDMTKTVPEGYAVKGVSTYYDGDGNVRGQWVKSNAQEDTKIAALLTALERVGDTYEDRQATPVPAGCHDDLLAVYPMGDPHIGMHAWAEECGDDFDLAIAERNLFSAVDQLVQSAPAARHALLINLGDFFHADNHMSQTTKGTKVDTDSRWAKIMRVGVRVLVRCVDRALEKHETVRVICEIGNHDAHTSVMLAVCLAMYYRNEPRVSVDESPAKFHWLRFGENLIGVAHGDAAKPSDLPGVMACDRARDWGETSFRYWYTGHVHHDSVKEYPGCTVETFRTLAPKDGYHAAQGYRSGQDAKVDVLHRKYGRIQRNTVGIAFIKDKNNV